MLRIVVVLVGCAILVGVARATYVEQAPARGDYLACADERIMAYGTGHRTASMAELAAITRWMDEAAAIGEGYGNWSLAQDRWMQCHGVGGTRYLQCRAAALPCRPKET